MIAPVHVLGAAGLTAVALIWLHERRGWSSLIAALGALVIAAYAFLAPLDQALALFGTGVKIDTSFDLLGRSLVLDAGNRSAVAYLFVAGGFLFGGGWAAKPSRYFYSAGMVGLALVSASLMVSPFLFAAIFLELAAMCFVVMISDPGRPARRTATRLLAFYTLAMMTTLVSGWLLDTSGVTGGAPELVGQIGRFLGLGFAVLMVVPPFHLWLPPAADESDSYSLSFVVVILYSAGLFFLLRFMNSYEWLRLSAGALSVIRAAGMLTIIVGGVFAVAQTTLGRAGAYILLADLGTSLLVVGLGTSQGYQLALGISGVRIVGLGLWSLAAGLMRRSVAGQAREGYLGAAYSNPLLVAAFVIGLLALSGAPLTAGFPGRWAAIQQMAAVSLPAAASLVLGIGLTAATSLRWLRWTLSNPELAPATIELDRAERVLLYGGIGLTLALGFFPQMIYPWIVQWGAGLANLMG
jgi:formate hydrogenlyase subunit 3/multisubunit Na+/H+ antiporter MnhD subunit